MVRRLFAPIALALLIAACTNTTPPTALEVTELVPAADATNVAVDTVVSATFSAAIDADTVDGAFTLATEGGAAVAGVVTYDDATNTATFTPDADLAFATTYVATVEGTVATAAGVVLGGEASWSFTTAADPGDVIDGVSVTPSVAGIGVDDTVQLTANVSVVSGTPSTAVTWSTDAPTVATVSATGLVTAEGVGTAVITATSDFDDAFFGTATITVTEAAPDDVIDGVTVTADTTDLSVAGTVTTAQLAADVSVVSGTPSLDVEWSSSDESVATVDADGLVTAVAPGTADITATSTFDGAFDDSVTVTVHDPIAVGDYAPYAGMANINTAIDLAFPAYSGGFGDVTFEVTGGALPDPFLVSDDWTVGEPVVDEYVLALDADGAIVGSTGFPGLFTGTVTVTDALGQTATADFELDLELDFNISDATLALDATQRAFGYGYNFTGVIIPGDRIQVSGVQNTEFLEPAFLDDLAFSLEFVNVYTSDTWATAGTSTAAQRSSWVINEGDGTTSRANVQTGFQRWAYDIVVAHEPSAQTLEYLVAFYYSANIGVPASAPPPAGFFD